MEYVYIDESGSEGNDSKYIVFASVSVSDPRVLEKTIKKVWKSKPQFHFRGEFHATKIDDATRKRILMSMSELDIVVRYHVIDKDKHRSKIPGVYYSGLCQLVAQHGAQSKIIIDKKDTDALRTRTINRLGLVETFKGVVFEESHKVKQLQAADIIVWSIGRMYEHNDSSFYDLIRHKESPPF